MSARTNPTWHVEPSKLALPQVGADVRFNSRTCTLSHPNSRKRRAASCVLTHLSPPPAGKGFDEEDFEEEEDPQLARLLSERGRQVLNPSSTDQCFQAGASAGSSGPHLSSLYSRIYDMEQGAAEEQLMMWRSALEGEGKAAERSQGCEGDAGRGSKTRVPCGSSLLSFFGVCAPEPAAVGSRKYMRGT